jgi:iron complex outermembrane receptor protein
MQAFYPPLQRLRQVFRFLLLAALTQQNSFAEDSIFVLDDMTITATPENYFVEEANTATRNQTSLLETPFSVSVISPELLNDSQVNRLEETTKFISGVQQGTGDSGFNTDVMIRGFSTGGGAYLNGLLDNQKFFVREMATVERTEILKGQSSVLYGSGSPAGVVNYINKKPQAETQHNVSISAGSYDFGKLVIDSTGKLNNNENVLYRFITAGQLADDFRANIINNRATLAPSITWNYAKTGKFTSEFEYNHDTQPYRFDNVYTKGHVVYDQSYVDPRTQSDRDYWRFSNALEQQLFSGWTAHLTSQYFHTERHDVLMGFYTFVTPETLSGYYRDVHDHYDQLNLRGELHGEFSIFSNKNQLIVGVDRNEADDRLHSQRKINGYQLNVFSPTFDYAIPKTSSLNSQLYTTEVGYYANNQLDLTRFWHLTSGVRFSEFDAQQNQKIATDQTAVTFSAGLSFIPWENIASYFSYNQSFQPNYGLTKTKDFLPAKEGEQFEFGIKTNWLEKRLSWTATAYELTQSNLITKDPTDADFVVTNGAIRSRGFETDLTGKITDNLQLIANYSLMDSRFLQHDSFKNHEFHNTPKHSGTIWSKYQLPLDLTGKFYVGGGATFVDARWGDDANSFRTNGYIRPDLMAQYHWTNWDCRFNIENLLDKRYVASSIYNDTVVQGNRLFFKFTVSARFD